MIIYGKRFMIAWICTTLVMFGLSYLWHGLFLNDYNLISYSKVVYFSFATVAYIFVGFLVTRAYSLPFFDKTSSNSILRGFWVGFSCGILVSILATTVNISFNKSHDLKYLIFDLTWQGIEQGIGGLIVGFVYVLVYESKGGRAIEEEK